MTSTKKKRARALRAKTGVSHQEAHNLLNKSQPQRQLWLGKSLQGCVRYDHQRLVEPYPTKRGSDIEFNRPPWEAAVAWSKPMSKGHNQVIQLGVHLTASTLSVAAVCKQGPYVVLAHHEDMVGPQEGPWDPCEKLAQVANFLQATEGYISTDVGGLEGQLDTWNLKGFKVGPPLEADFLTLKQFVSTALLVLYAPSKMGTSYLHALSELEEKDGIPVNPSGLAIALAAAVHDTPYPSVEGPSAYYDPFDKKALTQLQTRLDRLTNLPDPLQQVAIGIFQPDPEAEAKVKDLISDKGEALMLAEIFRIPDKVLATVKRTSPRRIQLRYATLGPSVGSRPVDRETARAVARSRYKIPGYDPEDFLVFDCGPFMAIEEEWGNFMDPLLLVKMRLKTSTAHGLARDLRKEMEHSALAQKWAQEIMDDDSSDLPLRDEAKRTLKYNRQVVFCYGGRRDNPDVQYCSLSSTKVSGFLNTMFPPSFLEEEGDFDTFWRKRRPQWFVEAWDEVKSISLSDL